MDLVAPELRAVESEVDGFFLRNPMIRHPFCFSAWHFLSFCEDMFFFEPLKREHMGFQDYATLVDGLIMHMKTPLLWLWKSCPKGGRAPTTFDGDAYQAARRLSELAEQYHAFEIAFRYASHGFVTLRLEGRRIIPSDSLMVDARYEAYDRLVKSDQQTPSYEPEELIGLVLPSLKIRDGRFEYQLSPRTVEAAQRILQPMIDEQFSLPLDWHFGDYNLGQYKKVWTAIVAIAYLQFVARRQAAARGCRDAGYASALLVASHEELMCRLARYSGIGREAVACLVEDLTYGNRGVLSPDPAIQPIVPIGKVECAISPSLVIHSSSERNFSVLLNKINPKRSIYSRLVDQKERLMRERICERLQLPDVRFFHGSIANGEDLPDVDLAVISDTEKACIIIELKWFINPAEVREVIERSEEIKRGICQLLKLSEAIEKDATTLLEQLEVDSTYALSFVVASANSIGHGTVQDRRIPVITDSHLVTQLNSAQYLRPVMNWLNARAFLPIEGVDYQVVRNVHPVGPWQLEWYGIQPTAKASETAPYLSV